MRLGKEASRFMVSSHTTAAGGLVYRRLRTSRLMALRTAHGLRTGYCRTVGERRSRSRRCGGLPRLADSLRWLPWGGEEAIEDPFRHAPGVGARVVGQDDDRHAAVGDAHERGALSIGSGVGGQARRALVRISCPSLRVVGAAPGRRHLETEGDAI